MRSWMEIFILAVGSSLLHAKSPPIRLEWTGDKVLHGTVMVKLLKFRNGEFSFSLQTLPCTLTFKKGVPFSLKIDRFTDPSVQ